MKKILCLLFIVFNLGAQEVQRPEIMRVPGSSEEEWRVRKHTAVFDLRIDDILTLQNFRTLIDESSQPLCFVQVISGRDARESAHFYTLDSWTAQSSRNGMVDAYTRQRVTQVHRFYIGSTKGHLWKTERAAVLEGEIINVLNGGDRSGAERFLVELRFLVDKDEKFQLAEVEMWVASQSAAPVFNYSSQPQASLELELETPLMEHRWSHPGLVLLEQSFFLVLESNADEAEEILKRIDALLRVVHEDQGSFVSRLGFLELRKALCEKLGKTEELNEINKEIEALKNFEKKQQDIANRVMDFVFQQRFDDARKLLSDLEDRQRVDTLKKVIEESHQSIKSSSIRGREEGEAEQSAQSDERPRKSRKTSEETRSEIHLSDIRQSRVLSEALSLLSRGNIADARRYIERLTGGSRETLLTRINTAHHAAIEVEQDEILSLGRRALARGSIADARRHLERLLGERRRTLGDEINAAQVADLEVEQDEILNRGRRALARRSIADARGYLERLRGERQRALSAQIAAAQTADLEVEQDEILNRGRRALTRGSIADARGYLERLTGERRRALSEQIAAAQTADLEVEQDEILNRGRRALTRGSIADARGYLERLTGERREALREQINRARETGLEVEQNEILNRGRRALTRGSIADARGYLERLLGERAELLRQQIAEVEAAELSRADDQLVHQAFEALGRGAFSQVQNYIDRIHSAEKKQLIRDALDEARRR